MSHLLVYVFASCIAYSIHFCFPALPWARWREILSFLALRYGLYFSCKPLFIFYLLLFFFLVGLGIKLRIFHMQGKHYPWASPSLQVSIFLFKRQIILLGWSQPRDLHWILPCIQHLQVEVSQLPHIRRRLAGVTAELIACWWGEVLSPLITRRHLSSCWLLCESRGQCSVKWRELQYERSLWRFKMGHLNRITCWEDGMWVMPGWGMEMSHKNGNT